MLEPENADARFELGEALFVEKQYDAAVKQLEKALALKPDHDNARRVLARAYRKDGRMTLAERTLEEAVKRRPDDASARDELAEILAEGGRADDALLQLEAGIRADPSDVSRLLRAAAIAHSRRLLERARGHLEQARRVAPDDAAVKQLLGEVALELGDAGPAMMSPVHRGRDFLLGRTRAALEEPPLREATASGALREAAVLLRRMDVAGAKRALVTASPAEQATAAFDLLRADLTLLEGDLDRSEKAFRRAVDRHPSVPLGLARLAEVLFARGRFDDSAATFDAWLRVAPDDPDALEGKGDALVALGKRSDAEAAYRKALSKRADGALGAKLADLRARARKAADDERPIGRIGALGWNATGGVVSMLEAVAVPGKGELIFTGTVGKSGQDAAKVAYSCLKARADALGITTEVRTLDLHLHFVDTELPKDGPSAGVALALAGISAYTRRPLKPRLAATGEITLQGAVKSIGGLHEKLVAAHLGGVETVLVPRRNLFEVRDLSKEVVSRVSLVYVDTIVEALEHALLEP